MTILNRSRKRVSKLLSNSFKSGFLKGFSSFHGFIVTGILFLITFSSSQLLIAQTNAPSLQSFASNAPTGFDGDASKQQGSQTLSQQGSQLGTTNGPANGPAMGASNETQVLIDPNELVLQSIQQAYWGPGFACKFRQKTNLFDREVTSLGSVVQAGNGTGKLRVQFKLTLGNDVRTTEQVSDGRVLWTSLGPDEPFRTVNLESVRTSIAKGGKWDPRKPELAFCLSIGGQSEVLRNLYVKYRWFKAWKGNMDGLGVWQLVGTSRTQNPPVFPNVSADQQVFAMKQETFPTEVRLTLARDSHESLFPFRIEYYLREKNAETKSEELKPFSTIEYFELQTPIEQVETFYQIQLPEDFRDRKDETKRYLLNG